MLFAFICLVSAARKLNKKAEQPKPRPKPVKLNTDNLPTLTEILQTLELSTFLKNFIKMGVTETRLLLRMTSMDFRMMEMEWESMGKENVAKLKETIATLLIQATVPEEEPRLELNERQKLIYGKVYLKNSVQSYEYSLASFGKSPPIGPQPLVTLPSEFGCEAPQYTDASARGVDYSGKTLLVRRGECTFLAKAQVARALNAAGLLIVNSEDRLESPSSGLGVDRNVTEAMVLPLNDLFLVSTSNTTWAKLRSAVQFSNGAATHVSFVPLKCHSGGSCLPVIEEEKALQAEVTWGAMRVRAGAEARSFEFLTSVFGAQLPNEDEQISLALADNVEACSPLAPSDKYLGAAVVVHRGGCRFDVKALHVQAAGGRLVVVVDVQDKALQRLGGLQPEAGFVGIPSVIVTAAAGAHLGGVLASGSAVAEFSAGVGSVVSDAWIDLSFTQWAQEDSDRLIQLEGLVHKHSESAAAQGSIEIVPWLQRRIHEITYPAPKSIKTDEL